MRIRLTDIVPTLLVSPSTFFYLKKVIKCNAHGKSCQQGERNPPAMLQSLPPPVPSFLCVCVWRSEDGCKLSDILPWRSGLYLPSLWTSAGLWLLWPIEHHRNGAILVLVLTFKWLGTFCFQSLGTLGLKVLSHCVRSPIDDPAGVTRGETLRWHGEGEGSPETSFQLSPAQHPACHWSCLEPSEQPRSQLNANEGPQWVPRGA